MNFIIAIACATVFIASANAQSSLPIGAGFGEVEAQLRAQVDPKLFMQQMQTVSSPSTPGGNVRYVQGNNNAALFTLPSPGLASGVIQLNACGLFVPHSHPRASEVVVVASGTVNVAFVEENAVNINGTIFGGRVLSYTAPQGASVTIPQGLTHYIYNNASCNPAQLISSFNNVDPGTVSVTSALFSFSDNVVSAATGLDPVATSLVRTTATGLSLLGLDQTCVKRCSGTAPAPSDANILTATGSTGSVNVAMEAAGPISTAGK